MMAVPASSTAGGGLRGRFATQDETVRLLDAADLQVQASTAAWWCQVESIVFNELNDPDKIIAGAIKSDAAASRAQHLLGALARGGQHHHMLQRMSTPIPARLLFKGDQITALSQAQLSTMWHQNDLAQTAGRKLWIGTIEWQRAALNLPITLADDLLDAFRVASKQMVCNDDMPMRSDDVAMRTNATATTTALRSAPQQRMNPFDQPCMNPFDEPEAARVDIETDVSPSQDDVIGDSRRLIRASSGTNPFDVDCPVNNEPPGDTKFRAGITELTFADSPVELLYPEPSSTRPPFAAIARNGSNAHVIVDPTNIAAKNPFDEPDQMPNTVHDRILLSHTHGSQNALDKDVKTRSQLYQTYRHSGFTAVDLQATVSPETQSAISSRISGLEAPSRTDFGYPVADNNAIRTGGSNLANLPAWKRECVPGNGNGDILASPGTVERQTRKQNAYGQWQDIRRKKMNVLNT